MFGAATEKELDAAKEELAATREDKVMDYMTAMEECTNATEEELAATKEYIFAKKYAAEFVAATKEEAR
jgi:hypothetical protein